MGYDMILMDLNKIFNEIEETKDQKKKWSLLFDEALEKIQYLSMARGKGLVSTVFVPGQEQMTDLFINNMIKVLQKLMKKKTPDLERFAATKRSFVHLVKKLTPEIDVQSILVSVYEDYEKLVKKDPKHNNTLINLMIQHAEELIEENEVNQAALRYYRIIILIRKNKGFLEQYEQKLTTALSRYSHLLLGLYDFSGVLEKNKETLYIIDPKYALDKHNLHRDLIDNYKEIESILVNIHFDVRDHLLSDCYYQLSDLHIRLSLVDEALSYLDKRLSLLEEMAKEFDITKQADPSIDIGITKSKIADVQLGRQNFDVAFTQSTEAVEILENMNNRYGKLEEELGFASIILASIAFNMDRMNDEYTNIAVRGWDMYGSKLKGYEPFPFFAFPSVSPIFVGLQKTYRFKDAIVFGNKILASLKFNLKVMGEEMKSNIFTRETFVYGMLAMVYLRMKKPQEGFDLINRHYEFLLNEYKIKENMHDSMNVNTYVQILYFMAIAASGIDDYKLVIRLSEEVIEYMPDNPQLLNLYAWSLMKLNKLDEANVYARKALSIENNMSIAWDTLANILEKQNNNSEAEEAYKKSLELDDGSSEVWKNYGDFLKKLGRGEEAEAALKRAQEILEKEEKILKKAEELSE